MIGHCQVFVHLVETRDCSEESNVWNFGPKQTCFSRIGLLCVPTAETYISFANRYTPFLKCFHKNRKRPQESHPEKSKRPKGLQATFVSLLARVWVWVSGNSSAKLLDCVLANDVLSCSSQTVLTGNRLKLKLFRVELKSRKEHAPLVPLSNWHWHLCGMSGGMEPWKTRFTCILSRKILAKGLLHLATHGRRGLGSSLTKQVHDHAPFQHLLCWQPAWSASYFFWSFQPAMNFRLASHWSWRSNVRSFSNLFCRSVKAELSDVFWSPGTIRPKPLELTLAKDAKKGGGGWSFSGTSCTNRSLQRRSESALLSKLMWSCLGLHRSIISLRIWRSIGLGAGKTLATRRNVHTYIFVIHLTCLEAYRSNLDLISILISFHVLLASEEHLFSCLTRVAELPMPLPSAWPCKWGAKKHLHILSGYYLHWSWHAWTSQTQGIPPKYGHYEKGPASRNCETRTVALRICRAFKYKILVDSVYIVQFLTLPVIRDLGACELRIARPVVLEKYCHWILSASLLLGMWHSVSWPLGEICALMGHGLVLHAWFQPITQHNTQQPASKQGSHRPTSKPAHQQSEQNRQNSEQREQIL